MPGAIELGRELDSVRRVIRRRCRMTAGLRGEATVGRIIDMVVAPLVLGLYGDSGLDVDDVAKAVGDDLLSVLSHPPQRHPASRG